MEPSLRFDLIGKLVNGLWLVLVRASIRNLPTRQMARRISKRSEQKGRKTTSSSAQNETSSVVAEPLKRPSVALVIAVVLTAILEVLDITIVSVSIPHMLGSFGATPDQITWVLTSYLVAAAVGMPLTGYLSERLGRRKLLNISILGFVIFSGLCGLSWNLFSMVLFRLAQGLSGAPLIAFSQAILLDAFPREKHGQALAIFGLGIMVAPVLGPVLGGWLTDTFVWRAVFYINIPIGLIALLLSMGELPRAPVRHWPVASGCFAASSAASAAGLARPRLMMAEMANNRRSSMGRRVLPESFALSRVCHDPLRDSSERSRELLFARRAPPNKRIQPEHCSLAQISKLSHPRSLHGPNHL